MNKSSSEPGTVDNFLNDVSETFNGAVKTVKTAANSFVDAAENKFHTQTSRTGASVARIAYCSKNNVCSEAIAAQLNANSKKDNPDNPVIFTTEDVLAAGKFFAANKSCSAFTKKQSRALKRLQSDGDKKPSVREDECDVPNTCLAT